MSENTATVFLCVLLVCYLSLPNFPVLNNKRKPKQLALSPTGANSILHYLLQNNSEYFVKNLLCNRAHLHH